MENKPYALNNSALELLHLELPDTPDWDEDSFRAALLQYAAALDLAETIDGEQKEVSPEWEERLEGLNDILFLRDEIEAAGEFHGWSQFDVLEIENISLSTLDTRLRACRNPEFLRLLDREYQTFRSSTAPDPSAWWWWIEC